jgi:hypothetical protein
VAAKSTRRVRLSQSAKDWLWSESGGHCQNPECRADLHGFVKRKHIGELAHIIPASTEGSRADEAPELTEGERALPENVVMLCPRSSPERPVNGWPADHAAMSLRRLVLRLSVLAGGGSSPSSARSSVSW